MAIRDYFSKREQNIAAELAVEVGVFVYFVARLLSLPPDTPWASQGVIWIVVQTIVLAIVTSVVLQVVINARGEVPADERDNRIAAKANGVAYLSLVTAICVLVGWVFFGFYVPLLFQGEAPRMAIELIHVVAGLVAALTLSSVVKSCSQLYLYHWGRV